MAGQLFDFDPPERFVAGTVGEPGERVFYLQASGAGRVVSVALEKVQVQALAEKLDELLDGGRRPPGAAAGRAPTPACPRPRPSGTTTSRHSTRRSRRSSARAPWRWPGTTTT